MNTTGTITSFAPTADGQGSVTIGGDRYWVETSGDGYALTPTDSQTLRFQLQPGDHAWFDSSGSVDRAQVDGSAGLKMPFGTQTNISYQFLLEPNAPNGSFTNTARWFVTGEMQSTAGASPPFAIELKGDRLQVVARYVMPGGNPSNGSSDLHMLTLWTDPNPIKTGQYNNIQIQTSVTNDSNGYLKVTVNGTQVVDYHGPLGYGAPTYWMYGLYREVTSQTVTASFRNLTLTTGAAATAPTQPQSTDPTTPTTPTSPITTSPTIPPGTSTSPTTPTTPTAPTTPTTPTTSRPSVTTPALTVIDPTLSVSRTSRVDLGVKMSTTDTNDRVTLNITGLPKYQTITNNLDGRTYSGNNITLTAAQVDSGLVLNSSSRWARSDASLTLTANAKDPVTGATASSAPQTISVANSRPAAVTTTSSQPTTVTNPLAATGTTTTSQVDRPLTWLNQYQDPASKAVANAAPALMSQLRGALEGVAGSTPQAIAATDRLSATATPAASLANQSYALLNQYLAGSTGRGDLGQIVASAANGAIAGRESFLTRPQH